MTLESFILSSAAFVLCVLFLIGFIAVFFLTD